MQGSTHHGAYRYDQDKHLSAQNVYPGGGYRSSELPAQGEHTRSEVSGDAPQTAELAS